MKFLLLWLEDNNFYKWAVNELGMARDLLLISNSTLHGSSYLDHCEPRIREILGGRKRVLFIPYARPSGMTWDDYTTKARDRFQKMGFDLTGIHENSDGEHNAIREAEAIFIGGGNTFVLLKQLYDAGIANLISAVVKDGVPYIGTSAGANVAGRTIMTTNDMPVAYPPSLNGMGAVPFNINPHYLDHDQNSKHMGESRETRIKEYHVFNDDTVVGLREGAMLRVIGDRVALQGSTGARIFRKGKEPLEYLPDSRLDFLLR